MDTNLYDSGGLSSYIGRPLGMVSVPPSYDITFFNRFMKSDLEKLYIQSDSSLSEYSEDLSRSNRFTRIFHFSVVDFTSRELIGGPYYLPYIDSIEYVNERSKINLRPLAEVINPTFVQISESEFLMYFFSNIEYEGSTGSSVSSEYSDDPEFLRRVVEFATNDSEEVGYGSVPFEGVPQRNDRNLYADDYPDDNYPKLALLSCMIRIGNAKINAELEERIFVFAEKPRFITYVGERFGKDFHPPMLVNTIQKLEWAEDKESSDSLDNEAVSANPARQIPYHHLISGIESIMYPGYAGMNFKTRPLNEIYDKTLDHIFKVNGTYSKSLDLNNRRLTSISIKKKNCSSIAFEEFKCQNCEDSSSSSYSISSSDYDLVRHFNVFDVTTVSDSAVGGYEWGCDSDIGLRLMTFDDSVFGNNTCTDYISYGWSSEFGFPQLLNDLSSDCYTYNTSTCPPNGSGDGWFAACICGGPRDWTLNVRFGFDDCIVDSVLIRKNQQTESAAGCYGCNWYVLCEGETIPSSNPCTDCYEDSCFSYSEPELMSEYTITIPDSIDPWGDDKPEFWRYYWSECEDEPESPVGGFIDISEIKEGLWKGEACIDGVNMFASLTIERFWYFYGYRRRFNLVLGLKSSLGGEFDIFWTGFKNDDSFTPVGNYERTYALGDNTPNNIEIV